jgi:phosphate transport system protein
MTEGTQRKALAQGLDQLNEDVRTLSDLSELAIRKAMDGLQRSEVAEAEEVATLDKEIYGLQLAVEKTCVDLIALHAPVAKDLRTITTCLGITTDLDRVGRYARDITEAEVELRKLKVGEPPQLTHLVRMGDLTIHMLDTAIRAFTNRESESVKDMSKFDDSVDDLHEQVFKELVQAMKEGTLDPEVGAHLLLVNRALERVADHAVNIGQRVLYMVTGEGPGRGILATKGPRPQESSEPP